MPLRVDHVEDDNHVVTELDEHHVRELVHHQFTGAGNPSTCANTFRVRRKGFDFCNDPPFDGRRSAWACFEVVLTRQIDRAFVL